VVVFVVAAVVVVIVLLDFAFLLLQYFKNRNIKIRKIDHVILVKNVYYKLTLMLDRIPGKLRPEFVLRPL